MPFVQRHVIAEDDACALIHDIRPHLVIQQAAVDDDFQVFRQRLRQTLEECQKRAAIHLRISQQQVGIIQDEISRLRIRAAQVVHERIGALGRRCLPFSRLHALRAEVWIEVAKPFS
jgi:hypothetical protein